ncbi:alpha-amylase family protein [Paenibacillus humicola]|uniref:alpha-amylase family protein n=1 Tax=Paenibacillus humicola TaxID=3110540 RepID=UPI00237BABBE|nr:alpha-amylase family protein [Paenibacillus humicola]
MDVNVKPWWKKPLRVIQPNLQVKDTALIDPERLASQLKRMGANAVVFNAGGIYAWYPTRVAYHTANEYLPQNVDLLREVIRSCHRQQLRFIARFDFSKAADTIYLHRPQWFARDGEGQPHIIGAKRPGNWSLLMSTCINGAYRNEAVALPVLEEVLREYEIDGIFFNAPGFVACTCEKCRRKYKARYGTELPRDSRDYNPDWASSCMKDNMENIYAFVKRVHPSIPMILYYNLYRDNLFDREQTTDMLCTEPQDVLSLGVRHIPAFWKPALSIKLGRSLPDRPVPFGIVHSSPGMDWRHTGLPPAEYRFWLAQIPAYGGSIWHSLTGIPDTIGDKRILDTVGYINQQVQKVEPYMEDALPWSQTALLWTAGPSAEGWADGLINRQIPFDVLLAEQISTERLKPYRVFIVPEGARLPAVSALTEFVEQGGRLIVEGAVPDAPGIHRLLGISEQTQISEELTASYLRFEGEGNPLQAGLEATELIAHRGKVVYCRPAGSADVLATLVPPFSPLESVGAPPERASLPVSRTDLPLAVRNRRGRGTVLYFPFSLSALINEFKLGEHYQLLANAVVTGIGGERDMEVSFMQGLQVTMFKKEGAVLIHFVNGAGQRPLAASVPLHDIEVKLRLPGAGKVTAVKLLISETEPAYQAEHGILRITVPKLEVWECLLVECG